MTYGDIAADRRRYAVRSNDTPTAIGRDGLLTHF